MISLHDPKIQKIMMAVIVLASLLVIAGVEMEPEDMALSRQPNEMVPILIILGAIMAISYYQERKEPIGDEAPVVS